MSSMSTADRHARRPFGWEAIDRQVADAVGRANTVYARMVEAQQTSRAAQERVAQVARDGQQARAEALAAGQPDPGPADLSAVEAEAASAADTAAALADAWHVARATALDTAEERAPAWQRAAEQKLERATAKLLDALGSAEDAHTDWQQARQQLLLARSPEARRRGPKPIPTPITGRLPTTPTIANLLAVVRATVTNASAPDAHAVLDAETAAV
jgi:hypothetical protein